MAAAHLLEGGVNLLGVDSKRLEHVCDGSPLFLGEGDKQMLHADEVVAEPVGFRFGAGERGFRSGRGEYLTGARREGGRLGEAVMQARAHRGDRRADFREDFGGRPALLLKQRHENMLGVPLAVAVADGNFLRESQRVLRLLGEVVGTENHVGNLVSFYLAIMI